jgi:hypothetical protein
MPKFPTFPTLYDECKAISISDLKRWGYLEPGHRQSGILTWSCQGRQTGFIRAIVHMQNSGPYLELDYKCDGNPVNYRIQIVSVPSNIGKGIVWYFVCPYTRKRCRKLYMVQTYFYHREAFKGGLYEKQTYSHRGRKFNKSFEDLLGVDKVYEQIYSKYFKPQYAGKPTKRYLKLLRRIQVAGSISANDVLRHL